MRDMAEAEISKGIVAGDLTLLGGLSPRRVALFSSILEGSGEPETLSEARAMLAVLQGDLQELRELHERTRKALREAMDHLNACNADLADLKGHDRQATTALCDVLATFLPSGEGWARSVSVPVSDLAGWAEAAKPLEG